MIDADRSSGQVQFFDAELLNDMPLQGISRLSAEPLYAFCAIVAAQGCQIHAGDRAKQPCGLPLLLHGTTRVDGAGAPLYSARIDANLFHPFEIERYPAIWFERSTIEFNWNGMTNGGMLLLLLHCHSLISLKNF